MIKTLLNSLTKAKVNHTVTASEINSQLKNINNLKENLQKLSTITTRL